MNLIRANGRGRLAEVLGHELRNPLASAIANISVSLEMTDSGDPRTRFLQRTLDELSRASTLLTSYLDFGRSGSPSQELTDLETIARAVQARCKDRRVGVTVAREAEHLPILGDAVLLERLVENLVENSFAMGASRVDIELTREAGQCVMQVSDDGPGIPAEVEAHLFEPSVSGRGSTGIGLALSRDVVESHGGSITFMPSKAGAVFRIALPVESPGVAVEASTVETLCL